MRSIRIIHGADFRLDAPYQGLSSAKAAMRREEQRLLLKNLRELAVREHADLMLLAGNLLDNGNTFYNTGAALLEALGKMPCPVLISPGNQDYYSDRSPWAKQKLPENVVVFRESAIRFLSVPSAGARVYGAAFLGPSSPALLRGFHAERKADTYNLLCMHGELGNAASACNPISWEELAACGIDYAALGHPCEASGLQRSGSCWYAWPGCPEGHSFEEAGDRYVYVVELSPDGCRLRAESIATRAYRTLELDITGKDPLLLIHTVLPDDTVRDAYRITLTGETAEAPDLRKLYQNLDEMFFSLQLRDRTRLPQCIWESAGSDTLRGVFLSRLHTLYDAAASDSEKMRIERAARWGLAAIDNGGEVAVHENS